MKATGADIWDFYLNGYPIEFSHDDWDIQVAYWPSTADDSTGAYSLLDDDKEYDLSNFGTFYQDTAELSFEDAYLAWKGIEKSESISFEQWYSRHYAFYTHLMKPDIEAAWNAAIASVKRETL